MHPIQLAKFACAAAFVAVTLPASAVDMLGHIRETHSITIAYREASVPFSYLDANKKPVGYAVDLCLRIADAIKRELKLSQLDIAYLPVTPANRIAVIAEGKADLECGSTTNNAERRQQVAFTISHFIAAARMVVRSDSGIKNWSDLRGRRVATTKGTTTVKLLNDRDKVRVLGLMLVEGRDHAESFGMVEQGRAEAFTMDDVLLYGLRANAVRPADFVIVGDPLSTEPYAIMLRKDDPAFKALVDREMARLINDGDIYKLYDKWFNSPIPPKGINLNMPMSYLLRDSLRYPTDKVGDK
ncbi:MAG TPA: amino acid ABC transporter substrate-binding protein [Noviherbaspirillum sp.]